jgi:hypothetical protein
MDLIELAEFLLDDVEVRQVLELPLDIAPVVVVFQAEPQGDEA